MIVLAAGSFREQHYKLSQHSTAKVSRPKPVWFKHKPKHVAFGGCGGRGNVMGKSLKDTGMGGGKKNVGRLRVGIRQGGYAVLEVKNSGGSQGERPIR